MGCSCTRKLGKKITLKRCMTEGLEKNMKNSKKEGERVLIRRTWEGNICDRKIT